MPMPQHHVKELSIPLYVDVPMVKPTRCTISQIYFIFGTTLYMFRPISPSIIRSLKAVHTASVYVIQVLWLLTSGNEQPQDLCDIYMMLYVQSQTSDDGRRDRPKHVECCSKNKINLRYCASGWFYYRNILRRTILQTSNAEVRLTASSERRLLA